jgi:hypothetical protein
MNWSEGVLRKRNDELNHGQQATNELIKRREKKRKWTKPWPTMKEKTNITKVDNKGGDEHHQGLQ